MTAASNRFQTRSIVSAERLQTEAVSEFEGLAASLRGAGVDVVVVDDTPEPHTPDSVFPNNWVSFHADGRAVLYPMEAPNRRPERRRDILETLTDEHGFRLTEVVDLSGHEQDGCYLEGTGSMVLDRVNRVAYACLSSRTHLDALGDFAQRLDYEVVAFDAVDRNGVPIYHTNVMMNVGEEIAVICDAAIARDEQRDAVLARLRNTGRTVLSLSHEQLHAFAGNKLELRGRDGARVLAMSRQARASLDASQAAVLEANAILVSSRIDTIEAAAGGSVRCMLAELHLPRHPPA